MMKILGAFLAIMTFTLGLLPVQADAYEYRIRPGDVLRVEVIEDDALNRDGLVAPDCRISVPLAGVLRVGGGTLEQARSRITSALSDDFANTPNVVVSILEVTERPQPAEPKPLKVYVIGEVNRPGLVEVEAHTTLLQALSMAGGFTDFAAIKRVQLRRRAGAEGERVYTFNYQQVLDGYSSIGTTEMAPGDTLVVPMRRLFE